MRSVVFLTQVFSDYLGKHQSGCSCILKMPSFRSMEQKWKAPVLRIWTFFFCSVRVFASNRKVLFSEEKVRSYFREEELMHRRFSVLKYRTTVDEWSRFWSHWWSDSSISVLLMEVRLNLSVSLLDKCGYNWSIILDRIIIITAN